MRSKPLLCAIGASLALAGCASFQFPGTGASPCNQGVCKVTITVKSCDQTGISATPDTVHVPKGAWHIQWDIATPEYGFTANGIAIPRNVAIPGTARKVFEDPRRLTATKFQFKDNNEFPGQYKYNIELVQGGKTCRYDPTISND
jgi:hypothetical protein